MTADPFIPPAIAIAINRFGLGARPDEALPADPKRWLLDQMAAFNPRPAALANVPTSAAMAAQYHGFLLKIRDQRGTKAAHELAAIPPIATGSKEKSGRFNIPYICVSAIAMIGWCSALAWGVVSLALWMFS